MSSSEILSRLSSLPDLTSMTLSSCLDQLPKLAKFLLNSQSLYLLSPLSTLAFASEIALKLKETLYIHAESFLAGNFSHGPMALVNNEKDLKPEDKTKIICLLIGEELSLIHI